MRKSPSSVVPLATRFWAKVQKSEGCWEWTAPTQSTGYGAIWSREAGRMLLAHRVSWVMHNGPIPDGLFVLHHCDNRRCVNPAHLWLGTDADNNRDMCEKGRNGHSIKTHCKHGHEFTPENTYRQDSLPHQRNCRKCQDIRRKKYERRIAA